MCHAAGLGQAWSSLAKWVLVKLGQAWPSGSWLCSSRSVWRIFDLTKLCTLLQNRQKSSRLEWIGSRVPADPSPDWKACQRATKQNKYYVTCLTGAESELTSTSKLRYGTLTSVDYYIYLLHMIVKMTVGVTAEFSLTYSAATQWVRNPNS